MPQKDKRVREGVKRILKENEAFFKIEGRKNNGAGGGWLDLVWNTVVCDTHCIKCNPENKRTKRDGVVID